MADSKHLTSPVSHYDKNGANMTKSETARLSNGQANGRRQTFHVSHFTSHITLSCLFLIFSVKWLSCSQQTKTWIRINQLGYLPHSVKVAVLASLPARAGKSDISCDRFEIIEAGSQRPVWTSNRVTPTGAYGPFAQTFRLNFSEFNQAGTYYLKAGDVTSPTFKIGRDVYNGAADFLLQYMRQQRCGFNPFLNDSCHTRDGFTVYGPMPDGSPIDAVGGWHDAADYLKYVATSANAIFNLFAAYRDFPESFADRHDASGRPGANGIADVLDEANWGLQWLLKLHPRDDWMFNQVADDRDHAGFRLPTTDSVSYGQELARPVYFCSGEPQGLFSYKNRSTGAASTAGKFASAFALAAQMYRGSDPEYSERLQRKALSAYRLGLAKPGVSQTAPGRAPYFYEENNWADDMELAAAEMFSLTGKNEFYKQAVEWSLADSVTPWMGADSARHYQWYPFINFGHYELARLAPEKEKRSLMGFYREGIELVARRGKDNPFLMGVPFIWCSNNLVAAFATQCRLYRTLSGDSAYIELEAAMRDWLFGCNPWGVSMVIGLPADGVSARDPHSSFTHLYDYKIDGGLLDGPVYGSIYRSLKYISLVEPDEYSKFQSELVVYHDDVGDYSTNEPTMDGTASLVYYLAAMAAEGNPE